MKNCLLFILFFSLSAAVLGKKQSRYISWVDSAGSNTNAPFGQFVDAILDDNNIPHYQEVIELGDANERIEITDLVFSIFQSANDVAELSTNDQLDISIEYIESKSGFQAILDFVPIVVDNRVMARRLVSFNIKVRSVNEKKSVLLSQEEWKSSSVLASGQWVKLRTSEAGIHKITYSQLQSWGFSNPGAVCLYGNGGYMLPKMNDDFYFDDLQQNAIYHGEDGSGNDCIFFYSTGTVRWNLDEVKGQFFQELNDYSDYAYYFLSDQGSEKIVEEAQVVSAAATNQVNYSDEHVFHESEDHNLIKSGRRWFGEKFINGQTKSVTLKLKNIVDGVSAKIDIEAAGRSGSSSKMEVKVNNSSVDALNFSSVDTSDPLVLYADLGSNEYELSNPTNSLKVDLKYVAASSNTNAWLDYITVNYKRTLDVGDQLSFRDIESNGENRVTQFNLSASGAKLKIWDVTDYTSPVSIPFSISGNQTSFKIETESLHEFVAFKTNGNLPEPEYVAAIDNQNLHQLSGMDMVIVSHPDFLNEATELAQFHQATDQLSTQIVTPLKIYNEFSGGAPDVAGIRNFLKMLYDKPGSSLKYVLLFGDGSFDNKNVSGEANNFILTYQSPNSLVPTSSFVTDDFFVLLDDGEGEYNGKIDLGIGRLPVKTADEAQIVVSKIKSYASTAALGEWRNVVCLIGDDEDSNTHMRQANQLADIVNEKNSAFYTDKIYFDAFEEKSTTAGDRYPGVTEAINNRVKEGALILNYTGHASETSLAHEKVLGTTDIDKWSNYNKLPIFVTATCEISRFDDEENSGGEHILFNPNGGGIGLFSTTRVVYSGPNFVINKEFYEHVFSQDQNGDKLRMGDMLRLSKNGINTGINKRNFTLLADPALSLAFPKYRVQTETINGVPIGQMTDTIGSLSTVTITGQVADQTGALLANFEGDLVIDVYDKEYDVETLGNGGEKPFNFKVQDRIIYKGVTTVSGGEFEFTFIVPKDISYAVGEGKISYYANNGEVDAQGVLEDFYIGGASNNTINDNQGPNVNLYLNDENFQSGDEVGKNSILIADVKDENGINTIGVGIGHDITAILDNDYSNIQVLNDYYLSEKDSYKKGQIIYPLNDLSVGEHTLKLKVWDVLNNSTEVEIQFVVDDKLEIVEVEAYPNPATEFTNIVFTHNRPDESFDAKLEIFNFSGSLVEVLEQQLASNGAESLPLKWQINENQLLIRNGAYLYRVTIIANDGYSASKSGKIIISRY